MHDQRQAKCISRFNCTPNLLGSEWGQLQLSTGLSDSAKRSHYPINQAGYQLEFIQVSPWANLGDVNRPECSTPKCRAFNYYINLLVPGFGLNQIILHNILSINRQRYYCLNKSCIISQIPLYPTIFSRYCRHLPALSYIFSVLLSEPGPKITERFQS